MPTQRPQAKRKSTVLADWAGALVCASVVVAIGTGLFFANWQAPSSTYGVEVGSPWTVENAAVLGVAAGIGFFVNAWIVVCLGIIAAHVIKLSDNPTA